MGTMPPNVLADYLNEIARIHGTRRGTGEISYYGALTGALNNIGESLRPRVFCVPNLRNRGAGFPDWGCLSPPAGMRLRTAEGRPRNVVSSRLTTFPPPYGEARHR